MFKLNIPYEHHHYNLYFQTIKQYMFAWIIRLEELVGKKNVRLIIRRCINAAKQTNHSSRRTIYVVRLFRTQTFEKYSNSIKHEESQTKCLNCIMEKTRQTFISVDIVNFYPSI